MQYERTILEMHEKIKKLEEEVELLKAAVFPNEDESAPNPEEHNVLYQRMTDEMIEFCYTYGKRLADGENAQELADEIVQATGMNRNSSIMYLYAINGMLSGTIFKRAISAKAIQIYFNKISEEYGSTGLEKAISSVKLHIAYRRSCGQNVDSLERLCNANSRSNR